MDCPDSGKRCPVCGLVMIWDDSGFWECDRELHTVTIEEEEAMTRERIESIGPEIMHCKELAEMREIALALHDKLDKRDLTIAELKKQLEPIEDYLLRECGQSEDRIKLAKAIEYIKGFEREYISASHILAEIGETDD